MIGAPRNQRRHPGEQSIFGGVDINRPPKGDRSEGVYIKIVVLISLHNFGLI